MSDNLDLWNRYYMPPPEATKNPEAIKAGFKCTSIDAMWRVQVATELFGPMGIGWGIEVIDDRVIDGAPIMDADGKEGIEKVHVVRIKLWYEWQGKRGEVTHFGQTAFVSRTGNGSNKPYKFVTDEEAPKKSLTDAMGKALSMIGVGAAVYMGKFDGDKRVHRPVPTSQPAPEAPESGDAFYNALTYINGLTAVAALEAAKARVDRNQTFTVPQKSVLYSTIEERRKELSNAS